MKIKNSIFFLLHGVFIWLLATVLYRLMGDVLFTKTSFLTTMSNYVLGIPVAALLTLPFYRLRNLDAAQQKQAAVHMAVPGMLLDSMNSLFFRQIFPNMDFSIVNYFGAWLLFGYTLILVSGWVPLHIVRFKRKSAVGQLIQ